MKSDIAGNVVKVRARFEKDRTGMYNSYDLYKEVSGQKYLQDLIDADLSENGGKLGIATEGLLWLKRYVFRLFINLFLEILSYHMVCESLQRSGVHVTTSIVDGTRVQGGCRPKEERIGKPERNPPGCV